MKLVLVEWRDAHSEEGWIDFEPDETFNTYTVGYVLHETDISISLAQSIGINGETHSVMTIPKACVLNIKPIKSN